MAGRYFLEFWVFPKINLLLPNQARYYSRKQVELSTILTPSQDLAKLVSEPNHPNSSKSTR